jgi:hypothetical protein
MAFMGKLPTSATVDVGVIAIDFPFETCASVDGAAIAIFENVHIEQNDKNSDNDLNDLIVICSGELPFQRHYDFNL